MIKVGIDAIGFYTPHYYLDLKTLARARNIDIAKYHHGLGQYQAAIAPPGEDIVTMAANAAAEILSREDKETIDTILFATEGGIDSSKSAGVYVRRLLNISNHCRVVELKQACYSATAGLQLGLALLRNNPERKVLILAADIARYGLNTPGEPSQGAGAAALLLSAEPRLLAIEAESGFYTEDVMDFWRPLYSASAIVEGRYSCDLYFRMLEKTWQQYCQVSGRSYQDHDYFCYHASLARLVEKAHQRLAKINKTSAPSLGNLLDYCRQIGNCYTAALYVAILSLLENTSSDLKGARLGIYSYGSGCVAEYFSAIVQDGYQQRIFAKDHHDFLAQREELTYQQYEDFYNFKLPQDGSDFIIPKYNTGAYRLTGIKQHQRIYDNS